MNPYNTENRSTETPVVRSYCITDLCSNPESRAALKVLVVLAPQLSPRDKIRWIKILREIITGIGLKEAKEIVEILEVIGVIKFD